MSAARAHPLPDPGERGVPRYSTRPLPPYRFVPGVQPHPVRDPAGHSYDGARCMRRRAAWSVDDWLTLDDWLYGVDLFNRFYFWEAHESWEDLWATCEPGTTPKLLLQGLIQIAAALLKTHVGAMRGAQALSDDGIQKLRRVSAGRARLLGLHLATVTEEATAFFAPLREGCLPTIGPRVPVLRLQNL